MSFFLNLLRKRQEDHEELLSEIQDATAHSEDGDPNDEHTGFLYRLFSTVQSTRQSSSSSLPPVGEEDE